MINIDIDNKKLQTDGENYWIAPNATIIGEVVLKKMLAYGLMLF